MVITDKFVYIHKPKTGGSFVTDALLALYDAKWNRLSHLKLALKGKISYFNGFGELRLTSAKHGGCSLIPGKEQSKIIVSTIRNPFDYYVSQFEFGWWKRSEWLKYYRTFPEFKQKFSQFPYLNFRQFMELTHFVFNPESFRDFDDPEAPGRNTIEFIDMYFKSPQEVYERVNSTYAQSGLFKNDMYPVRFIFTHKLNRQLYDFLLETGYPADKIEFILQKEKVLPQGKGRINKPKWREYYTDELIELVRKKDNFLFSAFPEFNEDNS